MSTVGQIIFSGLANGALYALVGTGFGLVSRSTGIINFAQGEFVMIGAMLTAVISELGVPVGLSAVAAVALTTTISAGFYLCAIKPARRASIAQLVLITIGFSIFVRGAATTIWGAAPLATPSFSGSRPLNIAGVSILPQELWLIGTLVVVSVATAWFFQRTTIGLAMRAGASNPLGASYLGIDHQRLGFYAFLLAGMLGAIGGAVWSPIAFAQVDIGIGLGIKGFIAAALGGLTVAYGPIAGGLLLGLVESIGAGFLSSAYQDAITYTLLLLVLIFRPQGLLGKKLPATMEEKLESKLFNTLQVTSFRREDFFKLLAGLAGLIVIGYLLSGVWLTTGIFALILTIVVIGLVLLSGYCDQLSLGQGAFMMLGAYSTGYLTMQMSFPPLAAMAVGVVFAVSIAALMGKVIFRLHGYYLSMASLAVLMIALTIAREATAITGGANGLYGIPPFSIGNLKFLNDRQFYYLALVFALAALMMAMSIARSRFGRALLAMRSSESAASAYGMDVSGLKVRIFAFSAALASVAGSLYVHYLGIANPLPFGIEATIVQLTALTLGGMLSLRGAFAGAAIVTALPSLITWLGGSAATQIIAGLQYLMFGLGLMVIVVGQTNDRAMGTIEALRARIRDARVKLFGKLWEKET